MRSVTTQRKFPLPLRERAEREGFEVEHSDAFPLALNETELAVQSGGVINAQARLEAGAGRELDEILHGTSPMD